MKKYKHLVFAISFVLATVLLSASPFVVNAAGPPTTTITCKDGTQVSAPTGGDYNAICASHGGYQAPTSGSTSNTPQTTGVKCADTNEPGNCAESTAFSFGACGNKDVGIKCLVVTILSFLSIAVGIAVVAGITIGGITYSTGRGNPGQVQKGVTIITNSVIGLLLYLLMYGILNFLIPGGIL